MDGKRAACIGASWSGKTGFSREEIGEIEAASLVKQRMQFSGRIAAVQGFDLHLRKSS